MSLCCLFEEEQKREETNLMTDWVHLQRISENRDVANEPETKKVPMTQSSNPIITIIIIMDTGILFSIQSQPSKIKAVGGVISPATNQSLPTEAHLSSCQSSRLYKTRESHSFLTQHRLPSARIYFSSAPIPPHTHTHTHTPQSKASHAPEPVRVVARPGRALHPAEELPGPEERRHGAAPPAERSQIGCRELRSTKYISDGHCTSISPIKELVCTGECLPAQMLQNWIGGAYGRKLWGRRSSNQDWRCVNDKTRTQRIQLQCQDGSTRTYKITVVTSCKCKRYSRQHNESGNKFEEPALSPPQLLHKHKSKSKRRLGKNRLSENWHETEP
ncbi:hypothetical protein L3Q82_002307 [Scortum barcoo]|uniref:Uncharacterized protein n=1 Tax=Scortum barcoo TaxID=214431 RepID=A0ACB8VY67_9TELE|nr:hypothetical protein L3Q82_002307 [Scortum barcoo]